MKSLTENAELSFRKDMSALMALMGITKHELAEMLGTNPDGTIRRCFGIDL